MCVYKHKYIHIDIDINTDIICINRYRYKDVCVGYNSSGIDGQEYFFIHEGPDKGIFHLRTAHSPSAKGPDLHPQKLHKTLNPKP